MVEGVLLELRPERGLVAAETQRRPLWPLVSLTTDSI
jgi:hypothetical protein